MKKVEDQPLASVAIPMVSGFPFPFFSLDCVFASGSDLRASRQKEIHSVRIEVFDKIFICIPVIRKYLKLKQINYPGKVIIT